MPDELRDQLTERARASGRSLNAEIIGILQDVVSGHQHGQASIDVEFLANAIADRVAARLRKADQG